MLVTWRVADDEHQAGVADDVAADAGHEVVALAVARQLELAQEHAQRPRPRVHLLLDAQHVGEVAAPHRLDRARQSSASRPSSASSTLMPHRSPLSRVDQLISASGARR